MLPPALVSSVQFDNYRVELTAIELIFGQNHRDYFCADAYPLGFGTLPVDFHQLLCRCGIRSLGKLIPKSVGVEQGIFSWVGVIWEMNDVGR